MKGSRRRKGGNLSHLRVIIRRCSSLLIHVEEVRMVPGVHAVVIDANGEIAWLLLVKVEMRVRRHEINLKKRKRGNGENRGRRKREGKSERKKGEEKKRKGDSRNMDRRSLPLRTTPFVAAYLEASNSCS